MNPISALTFPDSFIQDPQYINSCRLFFDSISCPPAPKIPGKEHFDASLIPNGIHLAGKDVFQRLTSLHADRKRLFDLNLIHPVIPHQVNTQLFGERLQRLSYLTSNNPVFRSQLSAAYDEAGLWFDDGPSQTRNDQDIVSFNKVISYGINSLHRIMLAKENGLCIAAGSMLQHNALKLIHAKAFSGDFTGKLYPLVTEFLKISVPHLVAKSYEDLLEIEAKLSQHLTAFKIEMRKLHTQIPETGNLSDSMNHIYSIVDRDINPKIFELNRFLDMEVHRFRKHLLKEPVQTSLVGCITAYVSQEAFLSSHPALAWILVPTTHFIRAWIDSRNEKIEVQYDNPMTFAVLSQR